jgi:uncharacterized membrane protein
MDRGQGIQPFPRGGGHFAEHVGRGGGWPDSLLWVIFALLLVVLLLAIVSLALDAYFRSQRPRRFVKRLPPGMPGLLPGGGGRAPAVLGMRYARGEISRDDYLQARADLGGQPVELDEEPTDVMPAPEEPPAPPEPPAVPPSPPGGGPRPSTL